MNAHAPLPPRGTGTPGLLFEDISVAFGDQTVLDRASWSIPAGDLGVLLGPSGSGKSSLLRVIAGLHDPGPDGKVITAGKDLRAVEPEGRGIILVSQTTRLFPHLDVARNIGFGLRMQGVPATARRERVAALLELVGLPGFGERAPRTLSGGQAQRVALARALVVEPAVLLLDEPFAQLDPDTRSEMHDVLRTAQREFRTTTLCVTHDRQEAIALADTMAVMLGGRIAAHGQPRDLMINPPRRDVAQFLGALNVVSGQVQSGQVIIPGVQLSRPEPAPGPGTLVLRPESVVVTSPPGTTPTDPEVTEVTYRGTHHDVLVALPSGDHLVAHLPLSETCTVGDRVRVRIVDGHGTWFPAGSVGKS